MGAIRTEYCGMADCAHIPGHQQAYLFPGVNRGMLPNLRQAGHPQCRYLPRLVVMVCDVQLSLSIFD